jgi:hypothetical protein
MVKVSFDGKERYEEKQERVVFHADIDGRRLRCLISRKTLEEHFTILGGPHMKVDGCMDIFTRHRASIESSARRIIGEMGASDLERTSEIVLSPSFL